MPTNREIRNCKIHSGLTGIDSPRWSIDELLVKTRMVEGRYSIWKMMTDLHHTAIFIFDVWYAMCTPWRSLYKQMNRNISFKILLCWLFIVFSFGWLFNHPSQTITNSAQNVQWFDQILDHYDYLSSVYWKQRYYVIDTYFNPNNGPVLLYICG